MQISSKNPEGTQALRVESVKAGLQALVSQGFIAVQANTSNYIGNAGMQALAQKDIDFFNKVAKDYVSNRDSGMEPVAALATAIETFKKNTDPDGVLFARLELDKTHIIDSNPFLFWKSPEERSLTLEKAVQKLG